MENIDIALLGSTYNKNWTHTFMCGHFWANARLMANVGIIAVRVWKLQKTLDLLKKLQK